MIFSAITTHYISAGISARLVRYDIIQTDSDTYLIKVIDEEDGIGPAIKTLVKVDEFELTRSEYMNAYGGVQRVVMDNLRPSFESFVLICCQEHRNSIESQG